MARFEIDETGNIDDTVRISIGGRDVLVSEAYEFRVGIFTQPAAWSVRLGNGAVATDILEDFIPGQAATLFIGDVLQQTGILEAVNIETGLNGTTVTLKGRDLLTRLHDDHMDVERTFKDATYVGLVEHQLDAVGLGDFTLFSSNRANRQIKAGVPLTELSPGRTVDQILTEAAAPPGSTGESSMQHQVVQARLNERRYEFLMRYLQLAGLFLWAAADGSFVLAEPNGAQKPMTSIVRRKSSGQDRQSRRDTNVISATYQNDTTHRFERYAVYGRGAGKKNGHPKALAEYLDEEMISLYGLASADRRTTVGEDAPLLEGRTVEQILGGIRPPTSGTSSSSSNSVTIAVKNKVIRSQNVRTKAQAEFVARRMAAEDRRAGWQLRYTVAGHTAPHTTGNRAVWTPDTVIRVDDELLGVSGDFYVSDVAYRRSPETATELTLMRPSDLIFGGPEA